MNNAPTVGGTAAGIRRVKATEPLGWLSAGVRSFASAPAASLPYGALFALAAAGTLYLTWTLPGFAVAFITCAYQKPRTD